MARLYTNENFPLRVVENLRNLGHDVLTVQEAGNANQGINDEAVLTFAIQQKRTVVTINRRDFIQLHKNNSDHTGIIVCTQDADIVGQAHRINQAILEIGVLDGKLIRINRPQS